MTKILNFIKKRIKIIGIALILITTGLVIFNFVINEKFNAKELFDKIYSQQNPSFGISFVNTTFIKLEQTNFIEGLTSPKYAYFIEDNSGILGGYIIKYNRNLPLLNLVISKDNDSVQTFQVIDKTKKYQEVLKLIKTEDFAEKNPSIFKKEVSNENLSQKERDKKFLEDSYFEGPRSRGSAFKKEYDYDQIDDFKKLKKGDNLFKVRSSYLIGTDLKTPGIDLKDGMVERQAIQQDNPELPKLKFVSMFYKNYDDNSDDGAQNTILEKFAAITHDRQIIYAEVLPDGSFDIEGLKLKLK
ncbi:MAG: hypothetical protein ACRCXZ_04220 [Patescibacteria group bacterium]